MVTAVSETHTTSIFSEEAKNVEPHQLASLGVFFWEGDSSRRCQSLDASNDTMNWKGVGRKRLWPISKCYPVICLEGLRKQPG
jgi:hypothetical protein